LGYQQWSKRGNKSIDLESDHEDAAEWGELTTG
jgi:hypothetical protein